MPTPCPAPPGPPPLPDPRGVALGIPAPWPSVQVGINPWPLGVTGLPSWFWVERYDGGARTASQQVQVAGLPGPPGCPRGPSASEGVTVRLVPTAYEWSFGDQGPASRLSTTSLGRPYPAQSDIQHTYTVLSSVAGDPQGYPVVVTIHFALAYQVNGGPWRSLADVTHTYTRDYQVSEITTPLIGP